MKNYIQSGDVITVPAAADVTSGLGHLAGSLFGVAQGDALSGEPVSLVTRGVFVHAKTSAQAWTVGAKVYWDNTNEVFTTTSSGNTLVGVATKAAANPSATGEVYLDGSIR